MLRVGDKVIMNDKYYVSQKNKGKVFIVKTEPQEVCGTLSVWLEDFKGCYAVDGLSLKEEADKHIFFGVLGEGRHFKGVTDEILENIKQEEENCESCPHKYDISKDWCLGCGTYYSIQTFEQILYGLTETEISI